MNPDMKELRDATLRRIGRNVVNFQKFERLLKLIIPLLNVSGTARTFAENHARNVEAVKRHTLGRLVLTFHGEIYGEATEVDETAAIDEPVVAHSFRIDTDPEYVRERQAALLELVQERNNLFHADLAAVNFDSIDECTQLSEFLDRQNERLAGEISELREIGKTHGELMDSLLGFITTDEFLTAFWRGANSD